MSCTLAENMVSGERPPGSSKPHLSAVGFLQCGEDTTRLSAPPTGLKENIPGKHTVSAHQTLTQPQP